jgi:phosphoserine phosphatase RsbU/P
MRNGRLVVRDALGKRVVSLDEDPFSIGRRDTSSLRLAGAEVSRLHAEISVDSDGFILRDKQSRFGTFVNGEQIAERRLASGDRIRIGLTADTDIVFLTGDDEESREAPSDEASSDLRQVAALLQGLRALGSGRVLSDVLALVLDSAIEVTGAERGFIMLPDARGELEFRLARGRNRETLSGGSFSTSRKIPEEVFRTGQMRIILDLLDVDLAQTHVSEVSLGIRHVVCAPLTLVRYVDSAEAAGAPPRQIGVLYLDSRERGALSSNSTRAAIETLATEAALALENARLYRETMEKQRMEQELQIAAEIQQALQPRPQLRQRFVEAAAESIPCRSIGADFFDFKVQGNTFSFLVGDVAGKGPPAALMSALMQGMCGVFLQDAEEPAIAVASMNKALSLRGLESRFVSLIYGVLSSDGALTYCNAGHNAPVVMGQTGTGRLHTGGPVLGLFETAGYEQETVQLGAGDFLVIWSDGVSEALDEAGEEFGDARLLAAIAQSPASADALVERIVATVKSFAQSAVVSDDITVMVLRYLGDPG